MSKRRDVLLSLKALAIAALPNAKVRGFDADSQRPQQADPGGDLVGHPGEPGEPEVDLSPLAYHYEHEIPIEFGAPRGAADPDKAIDEMLADFGAAIKADRTLGGLCTFLEAQAPDVNERAIDGAQSLRWASVTVIAHYSTSDPLA